MWNKRGYSDGKRRVSTQEKKLDEGGFLKLVIYFKFFGSCFSRNIGLQEKEKYWMSRALKTFGAIKMMFRVRSVSLGVKREFLYEREVLSLVTYAAETLGMRMDERYRLDILERNIHGICAE